MSTAQSLRERSGRTEDERDTGDPSSIAAYREIIPTVLRQLKEPTYFVRRELPPNAQPEVTAARVAKVERAV